MFLQAQGKGPNCYVRASEINSVAHLKLKAEVYLRSTRLRSIRVQDPLPNALGSQN